MNEDVTRYPLYWPTGWTRTPSHQRKRAAFYQRRTVFGSARLDGTRPSWNQKDSLTVGQALTRLEGELSRLGARSVVISSNMRVRQDGLPYSQQAKNLDDPGVAVYFRLKGAPRALACDRWTSAADNIAAIAGHVNAIRAVDRYGVGTIEQAFAGYAALPPSAADWWLVLGVSREATADSVDQAFRDKSRSAHPDAGGRHQDMARLSEARMQFRKERGL